MTGISRSELATQRASVYAPRAPYEPVIGGIAGAVTAWLLVMLFTVLAGIDYRFYFWPTIITIVVGFLIPWGFAWHREQAHSKAWLKEYEALGREGYE